VQRTEVPARCTRRPPARPSCELRRATAEGPPPRRGTLPA
jgi:hypothetical protein